MMREWQQPVLIQLSPAARAEGGLLQGKNEGYMTTCVLTMVHMGNTCYNGIATVINRGYIYS